MVADDTRTDTAPRVRVAIPVELLGRLIESGVLCAADVRCLDGASKASLQQLCLSRCAKCLWPAGVVPILVEASTDREGPSGA